MRGPAPAFGLGTETVLSSERLLEEAHVHVATKLSISLTLLPRPLSANALLGWDRPNVSSSVRPPAGRRQPFLLAS